jgi:hypothetical protein
VGHSGYVGTTSTAKIGETVAPLAAEALIEASPAGLGSALEMHGKRIEAEGVLHVEYGVVKLASRSARLIP